MGFSFFRSITIDHTQVGASNSTNFPYPFHRTVAELKTVANGGHVQNANGYDIEFFSDQALTTKLHYERELYVSTTGQVVFWIKIPTLSHTADTVIYMAYGDASITTDQTDAANVWNSLPYLLVHHFPDGTTLSVADSTGLSSPTANNSPTAAAGQIDGAYQNTSTAIRYVNENDDTIANSQTAITVEAWLNADDLATNTSDLVGCSVDPVGHPPGLRFIFGTDTVGVSQIQLLKHDGSGPTNYAVVDTRSPNNSLSNGTWYHVMVVLDLTTLANSKIYVNGVSKTVTTGTSGTPPANFNMGSHWIVGAYGQVGSATFKGKIDEFRISAGSRGADYNTATYNSQNANIDTVGGEQTTFDPSTVPWMLCEG